MKCTRPCGGHLVDHGQVPVRIVQDGAGLDALARDLHGVVVGQQLAGIVRRVADNAPTSPAPSSAEFRAARRSSGPVRSRRLEMRLPTSLKRMSLGVASGRRDRSRIGEGQAVLPREVGAQQVGEVGAVGIEMHAGRIGGAIERIGLGAPSGTHGPCGSRFRRCARRIPRRPARPARSRPCAARAMTLAGSARRARSSAGRRRRRLAHRLLCADCRLQPASSAKSADSSGQHMLSCTRSPSPEFCYPADREVPTSIARSMLNGSRWRVRGITSLRARSKRRLALVCISDQTPPISARVDGPATPASLLQLDVRRLDHLGVALGVLVADRPRSRRASAPAGRR